MLKESFNLFLATPAHKWIKAHLKLVTQREKEHLSRTPHTQTHTPHAHTHTSHYRSAFNYIMHFPHSAAHSFYLFCTSKPSALCSVPLSHSLSIALFLCHAHLSKQQTKKLSSTELNCTELSWTELAAKAEHGICIKQRMQKLDAVSFPAFASPHTVQGMMTL